MALTVLAVDDEVPALADLQRLLREHTAVGDIATATDAAEALRLLHAARYDVVFLDVRMPGLSGLDLARALALFADPPAVVFVTAHEEHALEAFEVRAVDYLRKPVRAERLEEALARLGAAATPAADEPPSGHDVIAVESGGRTRLVRRDDVRFVESAGDYVRLHTRAGEHLVRMPLGELEAAWEPHDFVRVHRGFLVRLGEVSELRTDATGAQSVRLGDVDLPVSRRHARTLRERLLRGRG